MRALGALMMAAGALLCAWGMRAATSGRRPLDLVGAVAAALGIALAGAGGAQLVVPEFLG